MLSKQIFRATKSLVLSKNVLSYRFCPVCSSVSHTAGVHSRRTASWLGVHQSMPRLFQHVQQKPLCAATAGDTSSRIATHPRIPSLEAELRESLVHLITDTAMTPRPLDKASRSYGKHVVKEFLKYIPRNDTASRVVKSFTNRYNMRRADDDYSKDKSNNFLSTLPGVPGSGKSTFLVHFPFSKEYHDYAEMRGAMEGGLKQPIITVFTFNSAMEHGKVSLGLRIIYGALQMSGNMSEDWKDFYTRHAKIRNMSADEAHTLLRKIFGADRLIFIGVDELKKVTSFAKQTSIMRELGKLLNQDGGTDVLVSSLNPVHINELVSSSVRAIEYIPITPLEASALGEEFHSCASALVSQIQHELKSRNYPCLNPFNERILRNIYLLASGHPRTVEHLKGAIKSGTVYYEVKPLLITETPVGPYKLLCELIKLPAFKLLKPPLNNEVEREHILSVSSRDILDEEKPTFRTMMEETRCTIFGDSIGGSYSSNFRLTTALSSLFKMLVELENSDPSLLGPLSRAAKVLIPLSFNDSLQQSELWERAHCLTIASRVHYYLEERQGPFIDAWKIFGVRDRFGCPVRLQNNLDVVLSQEGDSMQWKPDTLYVAPPNHPGFDFVTCLEGREGAQVYTYEEIKIAPSSHSDTSTTEQILANKLLWTLLDHLRRAQLSHLNLSDSLAALDSVYFILSRYGSELEGDMAALKGKVVAQLEGLRERASSDKEQADLDLVLGFVERHWERHVAVQGTREMVENMVPSLQPLAQLVQAISDEL